MLDAALVLLRVFQQIAVRLAAEHDIPYPVDLDRVISSRLDELRSN